MRIVLGIACLAGCAMGVIILAYVISAVFRTSKWYVLQRGFAHAYGLQKGLSLDELQDRVPGTWEDWGAESTGDGEVSRYHCSSEDGPAVSFYFLNGRLFSWHPDVEPADLNRPG